MENTITCWLAITLRKAMTSKWRQKEVLICVIRLTEVHFRCFKEKAI